MIFNTNRWRKFTYTLWEPFYDLLLTVFENKRKLAIELAAVKPGERLLIIGAGTGLDLPHLAPEIPITAIDITPAMVMHLKRRAHALGIQVDGRVMDGHKLEFDDSSFDVVFLHLILAVIPDPVQCAREAARVLRPGGRITIFDKFAPDSGKIPWALRLLNPLAVLLATNTTRRLGPILQAAGLEVVQTRDVGWGGVLRVVIARKISRSSTQ